MNQNRKKVLILSIIIPFLLVSPYIITQNAEAFKLTNYEIKLEVEFWSTDSTNPFYAAVDDGLMEQIIFDTMEPIAVGQWSMDDIIADNSLSTSRFPTFHEAVVLTDSSTTDIYTNAKLVVDPVIIEINTAQGINKATIQDQIVTDTQDALRTLLQGYGIDTFIWTLGYEGGDIIIAEAP